jgi:pantothenate synthetase
VRCARTLEPATAEQDLAILAAAWLGRTRLIDNITLTLQSP